MGRLLEKIQEAVNEDRFLISWHADERCEERGVAPWQLAVGLESCVLVGEHPRSKPHATVNVRETLADGTEVEAVWAWLPQKRRAKLVTVYFPG